MELQTYIIDTRYTAILDSILQEAYANKGLAVNGDYDLDEVFREFLQKAGGPSRTGELPAKDSPASGPQAAESSAAGSPGLHGLPATGRLHSIWRPAMRYAAAVVLLIFAAAVGYRYARHHPVPMAASSIKSSARPAVVPPGRDQAVLTLANGEQIVLDSAAKGILSSQAGTVVTGAQGKIVYLPEGKSGEVVYNTITTARGGQYQLLLADGTRVWLNAASSLRFPTVFKEGERKVELTGEGYFEVAKDARHPFIISFDSTHVRVLGTALDVMAYKDEAAAQTTLVEGSVRVSRGDAQATLEPGKMAVLSGDVFKVRPADVDQVIAWKFGKLSFNHLDLKAIMRQVSRWYNVDIDYEGALPDGHFGGVISRNVNLATVLEFLESNGIRCRQEGNRITVLH